MTRRIAGVGTGQQGIFKKGMEWGCPEVFSMYIRESGRACQGLAMWDAGGVPGCVGTTQ